MTRRDSHNVTNGLHQLQRPEWEWSKEKVLGQREHARKKATSAAICGNFTPRNETLYLPL